MLTLALAAFTLSSLIRVLFVLVVLGLVLWLIETQIPLAAPIKIVIRVVLVLALCWWLLTVAGLL